MHPESCDKEDLSKGKDANEIQKDIQNNLAKKIVEQKHTGDCSR
jgi:hypothetical protein